MHKKILFVCLGNICRSPTAQAVFEKTISDKNLPVECDSAGTAAYHIGKAPDKRSIAAAKKRSVDLSSLRARQAITDDFYEFDYIFAMDKHNLADLKDIQPEGAKAQLLLFLEPVNCKQNEMPDPYYGEQDGFEIVLDLCHQASDYWIKQIV
ncbi:MAG: low molecular weight phosphotyrosine protein phosphatase [Saccharospirillaceae bacterium]|nr:low molecular weight phosphotyrosine protein phosphatase [Pseudomonadales bacterium]NRB81449.1 low molecular weight phosphotyrosine protein phosphatase [Saccharospirillaceae bacterium]